MVFSSYLFCFFFLPLALLGYYLAPKRGRHLVLTLFSYVFYGWANPAFTLLMAFSTLIDWMAGLAIAGIWPWQQDVAPLAENGPRNRRQKWALAMSVCSNLALLGFFKYFNFAVDSYNSLFSALGLETWLIENALEVVLPLGISFYTFQSMSYAIDVYRGHAAVLRNPIDFACFVAMYPQLVAGPIVRFQEVADQLRERSHSVEKFAVGVLFFSFGLAKKVLLANPCGKLADVVFGAHSVHGLDAWFGALAYSFQIYFDFSGYSDMAIGLGLMIGFTFPANFDAPYTSRSITEFWRRWHMSLSRWLRDYLYLPLGGNRLGRRRTYLNLFLVMAIGGLWHGAAWNFVVWGCYHGLLLAFERWRRERAPGQNSGENGSSVEVRSFSWSAIGSVASTFVLVIISWVFFRATDLAHASRYLSAMFGVAEPLPAADLVSGLIYRPYHFLILAAAAGVIWLAPTTWDFLKSVTVWKAVWGLGCLVLALALLGTQGYNPFIYFIF